MSTKEQQTDDALNLVYDPLETGPMPVSRLERAYQGEGRLANSGSPLVTMIKFLMLAFVLSMAIYMGIKCQSTPANLSPSVPPGSTHAN